MTDLETRAAIELGRVDADGILPSKFSVFDFEELIVILWEDGFLRVQHDFSWGATRMREYDPRNGGHWRPVSTVFPLFPA